MSRAFIHILVILFLGACDHDMEGPQMPVNEGHRNFPLHVGDSWKYEIVKSRAVPEWEGQILTLQIVEKQEINGKSYFLFDSDFPRWVCPHDSGLFRVEGQKVIRLFEGNEYVWYDFGAKPGEPLDPEAEHWSVPSTLNLGYTARVQVIFIGDCSEFSIPNVVGDSCYSFYFFEAVDASWNEAYAPEVGSIGISIITLLPTRYYIREAVIGGKRYEF